MSSRLRICLFLVQAWVLLGVQAASAITIDEFNGSAIVAVDGALPADVRQVSNATILGGNRYMKGQYFAGQGGLTVRTTGTGIFSHSQDAQVTGQSFLVYDGLSDVSKNPLVPSVTPGFGDVDLSEDGANAFILKDFTADLSGSLTMIIFESSTRAWEVTIPFSRTDPNNDNILDPIDFQVQFSSFTPRSGYAPVPVSVAHIRAITFFITGTQNAALDVTISSIITNGVCTHIPVNGLVLDQCGVCNGDNTTCKDYLGVPNGTALPATDCDTGDVGACKPGTYSGTPPSCQCIQKTPPTTEICDKIDNDCDGEIDEVFDACGVQCGDGESCKPCTETEISETLFALDGSAKKQEKVIKRGIRVLEQFKLSTAEKNQLAALAIKAHSLQIRNWIISWTIPRIVRACPAARACVVKSNRVFLDEYYTHAQQLLDLNATIASLLRKHKVPGKAKILERNGKSVYDHAISLAATVPVSTQVCTTP